MRMLKVVCCAVALAALTASSARGDEFNKKTFLTFSGPVQIPGTTLPAGTYVFQLADLESNRHIVQIFGKEDGKLIATFLTIPDAKLEAPSDPIVMFEERPRGMPQAIKAWWYPGDPTGDEFVYPKHQALEIAKATHQPVLAMNDDTSGTTSDSMKGAKVARVNENGDVADLNAGNANRTASPSAITTTDTPATAAAAPPPAADRSRTPAAPSSEPSVARSTPTSVTSAATATNARATTRAKSSTAGTAGQNNTGDPTAPKSRKRLPRTASELGLVELLGAASLAAFLGARQLRKRFNVNV